MIYPSQADPSKPVLVAGDPERSHVEKVKKEEGITYHINQIKDSVSKEMIMILLLMIIIVFLYYIFTMKEFMRFYEMKSLFGIFQLKLSLLSFPYVVLVVFGLTPYICISFLQPSSYLFLFLKHFMTFNLEFVNSYFLIKYC